MIVKSRGLLSSHLGFLQGDGGSSDDSDAEHNTQLDSEDRILYSIACLGGDELYPLHTKETQYSDGYAQQTNGL